MIQTYPILMFLLLFLLTCGNAINDADDALHKSRGTSIINNAYKWALALGGTGNDYSYKIQQTTDGGYIASGYTNSSDGDVSGNHGNSDFWIFKLDSSGAIMWQKCLGGTGNDIGRSIQQTGDGGYIIAGYSNSNDGNVSGNHGDNDVWIIKLDSSGAIMWQKCLGGTNTDFGRDVQLTGDGGYIISGYTNSNDGNVSGNHGSYDYWIVKLDSSGAIMWQKCLGGTGTDYAYNIQQTNDGGYFVVGFTNSNDGNVSGYYGSYDSWGVKLDSSGAIMWQKCLGGTNYENATSLWQTSDGGYIVAGFTSSNNNDVSGNHGAQDSWIVKLDSSGAIMWQKCLGGTSDDYAMSIEQTGDGGYIVAGYTSSNDGDVSGNHGSYDAWIVKLDSSGAIMWQKCLGGTGSDYAMSIEQTGDGGYIVAGYTSSNDGDVSGNHGVQDAWIIRMDANGNYK